MDAAPYEKLLEELRSDLSQTAPRLQEMQTVEGFLQRRLETVADKSSYEQVLADISGEINTEHQRAAELERIDRFVSSQLGKAAFELKLAPAPDASQTPPKAAPAKSAPARPAAVKKPESKPAALDDDTKDEAPSRGKNLADMPGSAAGGTIQFGPDGFPIQNAGPAKGKSSKAAIPENAGMDGATINFGPDGFPLDLPRPAPKKK